MQSDDKISRGPWPGELKKNIRRRVLYPDH
jgi:hypothetical protein